MVKSSRHARCWPQNHNLLLVHRRSGGIVASTTSGTLLEAFPEVLGKIDHKTVLKHCQAPKASFLCIFTIQSRKALHVWNEYHLGLTVTLKDAHGNNFLFIFFSGYKTFHSSCPFSMLLLCYKVDPQLTLHKRYSLEANCCEF